MEYFYFKNSLDNPTRFLKVKKALNPDVMCTIVEENHDGVSAVLIKFQDYSSILGWLLSYSLCTEIEYKDALVRVINEIIHYQESNNIGKS